LFYLNVDIRGSYLEIKVLKFVIEIKSVSTMKLFELAKVDNIMCNNRKPDLVLQVDKVFAR